MDVRLQDLEVFLVARKQGALAAAARQLKVTPGHVTKSLRRLERQLQLKLVHRSSRGVTLTPSGLRVLPFLEEAVANLRRAVRGDHRPGEVTMAAASFLLGAFVPALAGAISQLRFRGLQMSQNSIFATVTREQFDGALVTSRTLSLPASWQVFELNDVRFGLFAAPHVAARLGRASEGKVRSLPFVTPISFDEGQWTASDDGCPLRVSDRIMGHEVQTIALGLDIAAQTSQVVFGPVVAARHHLAERRLAEVQVEGWNVTQPLTLVLNIDRLTSRHAKALVAAARSVRTD